MLSNFFKNTLIFLIFALFQVYWVKDFAYYDVAFCFIYIGFLLTIPIQTSVPLLLLVAFFMGLAIDTFYNTPGLHAAACVCMMYARKLIVRLLTPLGGYGNEDNLSVSQMGMQWYIAYTGLMAFIHHSFLFSIEAGSWSFFFSTLAKIVFSTLLSTFFIVSLHFLLQPVVRRK